MNSNVKEMKVGLISTVFMVLMIVVTVSPTTVLAISGFIANPTKNNTAGTTISDPNYSIYQNLALGFTIKYMKNMTINQELANSTGTAPDHFVRFRMPLVTPFKEHLSMIISIIPETNFLGQQGNLDHTLQRCQCQILVGVSSYPPTLCK
jgi:hypothetical protein